MITRFVLKTLLILAIPSVSFGLENYENENPGGNDGAIPRIVGVENAFTPDNVAAAPQVKQVCTMCKDGPQTQNTTPGRSGSGDTGEGVEGL